MKVVLDKDGSTQLLALCFIAQEAEACICGAHTVSLKAKARKSLMQRALEALTKGRFS